MKLIIFIFALPIYILKFVLYIAFTIFIIVWGGLLVATGDADYDEVQEKVSDLWDDFF